MLKGFPFFFCEAGKVGAVFFPGFFPGVLKGFKGVFPKGGEFDEEFVFMGEVFGLGKNVFFDQTGEGLGDSPFGDAEFVSHKGGSGGSAAFNELHEMDFRRIEGEAFEGEDAFPFQEDKPVEETADVVGKL